MLQINTTDAYLRSTFLVEFDKFSKNFVPVKHVFIDLPLGIETCIASPLGVKNMAYITLFTLVILLAIQGILAFW